MLMHETIGSQIWLKMIKVPMLARWRMEKTVAWIFQNFLLEFRENLPEKNFSQEIDLIWKRIWANYVRGNDITSSQSWWKIPEHRVDKSICVVYVFTLY